MKKEIITQLTKDFESSVQILEQEKNKELNFWFARDLQHLLGYDEWRNFQSVISKAKTACEMSGEDIFDHFVDTNKTIAMPKTAKKNIDDIMLTRYACYLIAQNGNSKKEEVAFAQTYFAVQTRKAEVIEQALLEYERLRARKKLTETEKELSSIIFEQTKGDKTFGIIRSKGDKAFFNRTTSDMKNKWGLKSNKPLADFMPTILLKAKDFATEITIFNAKKEKMDTEQQFSQEHIINNRRVRKTLIDRGIVPEKLEPEEDMKKVERRIKSTQKKVSKIKGNFKKIKK